MAEVLYLKRLYESLEALPRSVVGEIIDGQLHVQPRPVGRHAGAASRLGARLTTAFDFGEGGPGGW